MSGKSQFLKKLQARHSDRASLSGKSQADIAEFRLRMEQLQEQMEEWLAGTGVHVEKLTTSVTDLLVEGGTFDISGMVLRYEAQAVRFMPIYLYGQGVTGCVEVTLYSGGRITSLGRLFMQSGNVRNWTFTPPGVLSQAGTILDENTFFNLILVLLS